MDVSLSRYLFVQLGFIWFNVFALAYIGTFPLGYYKGGSTAQRFHRRVSFFFIAGDVVILIYAFASKEWTAFMQSNGLGTLMELLAFGFGWVLLMFYLSYSYVRSRLISEENGDLPPQGKLHA